MATGTSGIKMGRPKRERPAKTVRIDADLVTKAEMIARDMGHVTIGQYISTMLRPAIEREWSKLVRKKASQDDAGPD